MSIKYQNVVGFDVRINARIKEEDAKKISKVVNKNQDLFYNDSHFIRCAVIKYLRDFDNKGVRLKK